MLRHLLPLFFVLSCGGINPNAVFVTDHDKNRIDVLLAKAKVELDRDNVESAESLALVAYNRNRHNIVAAQQLASVYFARADLTLLDLASRVQTDLKKIKGANSSTQALDIFGVLQDVVQLSEADFAALGSPDNSTSSFFTNLSVYLPSNPGLVTDTTSPRYKVEALRYLNRAIDILCPFVDPAVLVGTSDARHTCTANTNSTQNIRAQIHFDYAMSHLLEAIYFNAVLLYSNSITSASSASSALQNTNLYKRVLALENAKFDVSTFTASSLQNYTTAISDLTNNITKIFDTSSTSMLYAIMVDLRICSQALGAIVGFPDSMKDKITGVLTNIESAASQAGQIQGDITNQAGQLKTQLSGSILTNLSSNVQTILNSIPTADKTSQTTTENISTICTQLKGILGTSQLPSQCT